MIIEIIKGTPTWVYLLLALLIYRGIQATKSKAISVKKLFIMPIVFLFLMGNKTISNPIVFIIFLFIGCFFAWLIYKNINLRADKTKKIILLPGSYIPIIIIIFAFLKGYFIGYETAVNPELVKTFCFTFCVALTSGIFSGIFIGRTAVYMYKYHKAEHEDLTEV